MELTMVANVSVQRDGRWLSPDHGLVRAAIECYLDANSNGVSDVLPSQLRTSAINLVPGRENRSALWRQTNVATFRDALTSQWCAQLLAERNLAMSASADLRDVARVRISIVPMPALDAQWLAPVFTPVDAPEPAPGPRTHHYVYVENGDVADLTPDHQLLPIDKWRQILRGIRKIAGLPPYKAGIMDIVVAPNSRLRVPLAGWPMYGDHNAFRAALTALYLDLELDAPEFKVWVV
jgi:hypothetical protein